MFVNHNPTKYEVPTEQYLRSILDISVKNAAKTQLYSFKNWLGELWLAAGLINKGSRLKVGEGCFKNGRKGENIIYD